MEGCFLLLLVVAFIIVVVGGLWWAIWHWLVMVIFPTVPDLSFWQCLLLGFLVGIIFGGVKRCQS